jgi:hypothetical protein
MRGPQGSVEALDFRLGESPRPTVRGWINIRDQLSDLKRVRFLSPIHRRLGESLRAAGSIDIRYQKTRSKAGEVPQSDVPSAG